jgi:hypothetical protein
VNFAFSPKNKTFSLKTLVVARADDLILKGV